MKTAFVFPGQGSQYVGMGRDLYEADPTARALYQQANDLLGFDVAAASFEGPEETLKQTQITQPALYVLSVILGRLLDQRGISAQAAAGHSLGEFSALTYAGVFSFEEGLRLVHGRARLMGETADAHPGAMAALIGLEAETVREVCAEASRVGIVVPANFNAPGQIVISGTRPAVEEAIEIAKARGAKRAVLLAVSGAFHSPLMEPAAESLQHLLDTISCFPPRIPVYLNVTAQPIRQLDEIKDLLARQLTHSVRWIETIQAMVRDGVSHFIEVGPGSVLTGLIRRIAPGVSLSSCGTWEDLLKLTQAC